MSDNLDDLLGFNEEESVQSAPRYVVPPPTTHSSGSVSNVVYRYRDAYLVARFTTGIGATIKIGAIVIAVVIAGLAMTVANQMHSYGTPGQIVTAAPGLIGAAVVGGFFYVLGVLISAHGQLLKATIDSAVHTSPFLSDAQRAEMVNL